MGDGRVQIAYLHAHNVSHSWHESMMRLAAYDSANECRVVGTGGPFMIRSDTGGLVESRNLAVQRFLDETEHEWLFLIDTDMGFAPDVVDRLVDAADPAQRPVVGALCFALRETRYDGMGGRRVMPVPTLFNIARTPQGHMGFSTRWHYPANTLVQVAATGAACLLVHRAAAEKVRAEHKDHWFDQVRYQDGRLLSEDLSFCYRLGAAGIPIFVHTGVKTTHHKQVWIGAEDYTPPIDATDLHPATEQVAVLVPVLRRPQNAAPFMTSVLASTGLANVYAIADADDTDTITAWRNAGAKVIVTVAQGRPTSFAESVNRALPELSAEPWLFLVGDDVKFHPGWLDHAQHVGRISGAQVVGVNDLGNPRTLAGEHAAHLLISRQYIEEQGASWDGPGVVAHEGYRHWFVDDEIVTAAKARGVWAMAPDAVVEHLHPLFGKGRDDEVYQLGQSHAVEDGQLFERRLAEHALAGV